MKRTTLSLSLKQNRSAYETSFYTFYLFIVYLPIHVSRVIVTRRCVPLGILSFYTERSWKNIL